MLNDVITALVEAGITVVVAAGNDNQDSCNYSPSSTPSAITVAATQTSDKRATFSNYGSCVDIIAPGTSVKSAYIGGTTKTASMSGTSMASPHVCGLASILRKYYTTPAEVTEQILTILAQNDKINLDCTANSPDPAVCSLTPNKMIHSTC